MKNRIKEIIETKGLKVTQILEQTGLSKSYFYDVMNGESIPGLTNARIISEAIGEPLDSVFPNEEQSDSEGA